MLCRSHHLRTSLCSLALCALAQLAACGAGTIETSETEFGATEGGASVGHVGPGGTPSGEGGSTGSSGNSPPDLIGSGNDGGSTTETCAATNAEAQPIPLSMFIMFDRSGSMDEDNRWTNATAALKAFLQSPDSADLGVALRFFPTNDGCDDSDCSLSACSEPLVAASSLSAESAPTDAHEAALVAAIDDTSPGGYTPMYAALGGATTWAVNHVATHPAEQAIVVLVTDGEPNGCEEDIDAIAGLAGVANTASGILTYAVGLEGSSESQMNTIAVSGGTGQAYFIGSGNVEQELLAAFQEIRNTQVSCEFLMPEAPVGETIDLGKVNVKYTKGDDGSAQTFARVENEAACTDEGGWYYDDPSAPTKIELCATTCTTVQADPLAKIDVVLGCETIVN